MRKDLVKEGRCSECNHKPLEHKEDENYWVECEVVDCKCDEYDE